MTANTTAAAYRQLRRAVAALCSSGELASRLAVAYQALTAIDSERDLPETLRHRFEELLADIAYGADSVADALQRMSAPDREHLAGRIVSMFDEAVRLLAADA